MIPQRFRTDYDGEFVVIDTVWKGGRKLQSREWIANPIVNQHISGRAVVIGNGDSQRSDVTPRLEKHRGGLLGKKKLQTYGCHNSWTHMRLDFCVEYEQDALQKIAESNYNDNTVVYTTTRNCLRMPGQFYIIPYGVRLEPAALAAYLAAFDGHQEIFFVGVDGKHPDGTDDVATIRDVTAVIKSYPGVQFVFVTDGAYPPDAWRNNANAKWSNYKDFISYCDV